MAIITRKSLAEISYVANRAAEQHTYLRDDLPAWTALQEITRGRRLKALLTGHYSYS